jgi:hypothetical protein
MKEAFENLQRVHEDVLKTVRVQRFVVLCLIAIVGALILADVRAKRRLTRERDWCIENWEMAVRKCEGIPTP